MVGVHVKSMFGWLRNILHQYNLMLKYCCFQKNQSSYSRPTWKGLPDVAVRKIFGQLKTRDRARLMRVSKSWKRILTRDDLPTPPELWWFHSDSYVTHVDLGSSYSFELPEFHEDIRGGWLCGSSGGWFVIGAPGPKLNLPDMFLWNPLSDVVMILPPLSTLPFLPQLLESGPEVYSISSYIKRVHVFSPECVVAVVFSDPDDGRKQDYLALCTPKDKKWRVFEGDHFHSMSDILFHDGKLYVLAKHIIMADEDKKGRKAVYRMCLSKCQVEVCVLCLDYKADEERGDVNFFYNANNPVFNITYGVKISEHLVEFSGELLVMAVVFDMYEYNSNGDGPVETFRCDQIGTIEVRKVDGLQKVESLGDKLVIMLADTGSLTVPLSLPADGGFESGIFFVTDYGRGIVGDDDDDKGQCVVRQQGVFDVENGVLTFYDVGYIRHPGKSIRGWHTPKLF